MKLWDISDEIFVRCVAISRIYIVVNFNGLTQNVSQCNYFFLLLLVHFLLLDCSFVGLVGGL